MTAGPAGNISEDDRVLLATMTAELSRLEEERDSLAVLIRAEVVEGLAEGRQPEELAEFLWGPVPERGDPTGVKERRARLTRIRQYHHLGRREIDLGPARPAYGGRASSRPAPPSRGPVKHGALARRILREPDKRKRMSSAEAALRQVIGDYNALGRDRRQKVMSLDDLGVKKDQIAAAMGCSQARVSKMSNDARRGAGLPVAPQRGGKKPASAR